MALAYMTKEGYKKRMEEIAYLENFKRPEISRAIAEARDKGDLSENAEYDAAKEAQGMLEMKISQLKGLVANARIIDDSKLNTHHVQLLNAVTIKNVKTGLVMKYTIVAESEANLKEHKIASNSPIAKGLLGREVGDVADITTPSGIISFEIMDISLS
ncbi:MAG: transcription elongation factor GreA [Muribaculaceae bacterium]